MKVPLFQNLWAMTEKAFSITKAKKKKLEARWEEENK